MIYHVWILRGFDECLIDNVNLGGSIERSVFDTLERSLILIAREMQKYLLHFRCHLLIRRIGMYATNGYLRVYHPLFKMTAREGDRSLTSLKLGSAKLWCPQLSFCSSLPHSILPDVDEHLFICAVSLPER